MNYEKIHKKVQQETAVETIERVILALRCCKQPLGCSPECPYVGRVDGLLYPISYCQGVMVGQLSYVVQVLKEKKVEV